MTPHRTHSPILQFISIESRRRNFDKCTRSKENPQNSCEKIRQPDRFIQGPAARESVVVLYTVQQQQGQSKSKTKNLPVNNGLTQTTVQLNVVAKLLFVSGEKPWDSAYKYVKRECRPFYTVNTNIFPTFHSINISVQGGY